MKIFGLLRLWGYLAAISTIAVASMVASAGDASAAGLLLPATAADARAAAGKAPALGSLVTRSRLVRLNREELARHVAPLGADTAADRIERAKALDGVITIELFRDVAATFRRKDVDQIGDSGYAWIGEVDNSPLHFVSLIVDEGQITGHVQLADRLFRIDPLGDGVHRVTELDSSRFPPEHPGKVFHAPIVPNEPGNDESRDGASPRAPTSIRVLVAYTAAARLQSPNIKNEIRQSISLANAGYANTRIPIRLVLARIISAGAYVESSNIVVDLNNLDGTNGATLLAVRNARNTFTADLVSLFRSNHPAFCGIANLVDAPSAATTAAAYSVMNRACVSNFSFHHELGHNMGLRHDYYVDPTPGVGYAHGYVNATRSCRIRTIMGYNDRCAASGFNCTRVNVFSTEDWVWNTGSRQCKIGIKKGKRRAADNTQRLKEVRRRIGAYRIGGKSDAVAAAGH
jgi:hypothetical protein